MILVPLLSARFKPIQNQANVVILKSKYLIGDRSNGVQPKSTTPIFELGDSTTIN